MSNNVVQLDSYIKKAKVMSMCKTLKKIQHKTPDELLKEYNITNTSPIDIEKLVASIGISVLPMNFSKLKKYIGTKKDILGLVITREDDAFIFYKEGSSLNRKRFTIAHELAHCCKFEDYRKPHIEYRTDDTIDDKTEIEMDIFAGELLIPINILKREYINMQFPSSELLAKQFQVSIKVMEARLNHLNISYFDKRGFPKLYG